MKTKRQVTEPRKKKGVTFGLVANGSSGDWDICVDETLEGPQRWFLEFDGPVCYLTFRVAHPSIVQQTLDFLRSHLGPEQCHDKTSARQSLSNELELSDFDGMSVKLLWDSEFNDRCFILLSGKSEFCTRITVDANHWRKVVDALDQVCDELDADGILAKP